MSVYANIRMNLVCSVIWKKVSLLVWFHQTRCVVLVA